MEPPARLHAFCEGVIEASWLAAHLLVPLFFVAFSAQSFDPAKAALLESLVVLASCAWLLKVVTGGRYAAAWSDQRLDGTETTRPTLIVAAVVLSAAVLLLASMASVDPGSSWRGSYERAFGAVTRLSLVALFGLILAHLRNIEQVKRLAFVVLAGSLPVCLFALLQRLGSDPLSPRLALERPETTLGNPIFLGAYLCVVFFLSAALAVALGLFDRLVRPGDGWRRGVVAAILGLQLLTLVLSGSRGPVLGSASGLLLLGFLWAATRTRIDIRRRHLFALLAGVVVAYLLTLPEHDAVLEGRASAEEKGHRLLTLFDASSPTARVRRLVWLSGLGALRAETPLLSAIGADPHPEIRRWLGFGPEASAFALDQHRDPRLNLLERGSVPDRAHNRLLQATLDAGLVGAVAFILLQLALADAAAASLFSASRRSRLLLGSVLLVGAGLGAGLCREAAPELVMLGAVAGGALALVCSLVAEMLRGGREGGAAAPVGGRRRLSLMLLLSGCAAHLVEGQFGIDTVAVRLPFWVGLAVLAVLVRAQPVLDGGEAGARSSAVGGAPALTLLLLLFVCYVMLLGRSDSGAAFAPLVRPRLGIGWILFTTLVICWVLGEARPSGRRLACYAVPPLLLLGPGFAAVSAVSRAPGGTSPAIAAAREGLLVQCLFSLLVVATVWIGWRLTSATSATRGRAGGGDRKLLLGAFLLILVGATAAATVVSSPIRAGIALKMARRAEARGETSLALDLCDRAASLERSEARYRLQWAQIALGSMYRRWTDEQRSELQAGAGRHLESALLLEPFDADHVANRGRYFAKRSNWTTNQEQRDHDLARARESLERARAMRPSSPTVLVDLAGVEEAQGETAAALRLRQMAQVLDPGDAALVLGEVRLRQKMLAEAELGGDAGAAAEQRRRIESLLLRALQLDPENLSARESLRRLRRLGAAGGPSDLQRVAR